MSNLMPTKDQYILLKSILKKYNFDDQANMYKLFKFAKQSGLKYFTFHRFTTYVKSMGVKSVVKREGDQVKRSLIYIAGDDIYLKHVFPEFDRCPTCKGKGIIQINLTETK